MATLILPVCPQNAASDVAAYEEGQVATCTAMQWQEVDTSALEFDLVSWLQTPANQAEFAGFFGAGFMIVGIAHATGWGVRALLSLIDS